MEESTNYLSCKICLFPYDHDDHNPKVIQCGHTLCKSCISLITTSSSTSSSFKCPFCKKELNKSIEPVINYEILSLLHFKKVNNSCSIHEREVLNFYCEDDQLLICQLCLLNKHLGHKIVKPEESHISKFLKSIEDFQAFEKKVRDLKYNQANGIKGIFRIIDEQFSDFIKYTQEIKNQIKFKYYTDFKKLKDILDMIKEMDEAFTSQYEEIKKGKAFSAESLESSNKQFEIIKSKFSGVTTFSDDLMENEHCVKVFEILNWMKSFSESLRQSINSEELTQGGFDDIENVSEYLLEGKTSAIKYEIKSSAEHTALISLCAMKSTFHTDTPNEHVLNILKSIDRGDFVANNNNYNHRYIDSPLPIGWNTTISAPHMHMITLNYFSKFSDKFPPTAKAIDIGCGSGYFTVALSKLLGPSSKTVALDHIEEIISFAKANISKSHKNYIERGRISFACADGREGYNDGGPYHIIHVGAACENLPQALVDQLLPGGMIWIPIGPKRLSKMICLVTKDLEGNVKKTQLMPVNYAEMQSREDQLQEADDDDEI